MAFLTNTLARLGQKANLLRISCRSFSIPATRMLINQQLIRPSVISTQFQNSLLKQVPNVHQLQVRSMASDVDSIEEVTRRVMDILKLYDKIDPKILTSGSHFMKDLGLDSLDHVEIIVAVENDFVFEIPDDKAETLLTPQEIIDYICDCYDIDS